MVWDPVRFERFLAATEAMADGRLTGYGYPHVVMPYDAVDELPCIDQVRQMPALLRARGFKAILVPVAQRAAAITREFASIPIRTAREAAQIENDMARPGESDFSTRVARRIQRELPEDTQVLVLARLGALHPFATVSGLLDKLYRGGVRCTVAAVYPGASEGVALSFLGEVENHGGYRAHIVT